LNSGSTSWATPPTPPLHFYCDGFFWDRVSWTNCMGWLWNVLLLISASWVAWITGVTHQHMAPFLSYELQIILQFLFVFM
jgi:hypothetical protein